MLSSIIILAGIIAGGLLGVLAGFAASANKSATAGYSFQPKNRLVALIATPTHQLSSTQNLLLLVLVLCSLPVSLALLTAPLLVQSVLGADTGFMLYIAVGIEVVAIRIFRNVGARIWLNAS